MTETDTTYNGWMNRQTWAINLHLSNDYGLYLQTLELVADCDTDIEAADRIEEWLTAEWEHMFHDECCSHRTARWVRLMVGDMVEIGPIDWLEIAEAFREE